MNKPLVSLMSSCLLFAAGQVLAADDTPKQEKTNSSAMSQSDTGKDSMSKQGTKKKKHHKAKSKKRQMGKENTGAPAQ